MAMPRKLSRESEGGILSQAHRRMSRFGERRMSMMRRPSMSSFRTDNSSQRPPVKLQNTYRLEPKEGEFFNASRVERTLKSIMESYLAGETYDSKKSPVLARNLSDVIRGRMREMHFPRYKYVCHAMIGQLKDQGLANVSRCVWNTATDNSATATYKNGQIYAVATVYACYYE